MASKTYGWFGSEPIPDLVNFPALVAGGGKLLLEFLHLTSLFNEGGTINIASPYIDIGPVLRRHLKGLRHQKITFNLLTTSVAAISQSATELLELPWLQTNLFCCDSLHAKLYSFRSSGGHRVSLVGSQNLTERCVALNKEAGILMYKTPGEDSNLHTELLDYLEQLQLSSLKLDTLAALR